MSTHAQHAELLRTAATGAILGGRYRIERQLGSGGMGSVFEATDLHRGHRVALKLLHRRLHDDAQAVERFRREGELLSSLDDPSIVRVHEVGILPPALPFVAMELVEGPTLESRLESGPLTPRELLPIVRGVADGLAALHARGVLHRDLKPANVLLAPDGRVKLVDFGVAMMDWKDRLTGDGQVVGTLYYMSPEQLEGKRDLDARVDVYSLGVLLYEALAGRRPFDAPDQDLLWQILRGRPRPLESGDPRIDDVVHRAIHLDRERRPRTATELADAFADAVHGVVTARGPQNTFDGLLSGALGAASDPARPPVLTGALAADEVSGVRPSAPTAAVAPGAPATAQAQVGHGPGRGPGEPVSPFAPTVLSAAGSASVATAPGPVVAMATALGHAPPAGASPGPTPPAVAVDPRVSGSTGPYPVGPHPAAPRTRGSLLPWMLAVGASSALIVVVGWLLLTGGPGARSEPAPPVVTAPPPGSAPPAAPDERPASPTPPAEPVAPAPVVATSSSPPPLEPAPRARTEPAASERVARLPAAEGADRVADAPAAEGAEPAVRGPVFIPLDPDPPAPAPTPSGPSPASSEPARPPPVASPVAPPPPATTSPSPPPPAPRPPPAQADPWAQPQCAAARQCCAQLRGIRRLYNPSCEAWSCDRVVQSIRMQVGRGSPPPVCAAFR